MILVVVLLAIVAALVFWSSESFTLARSRRREAKEKNLRRKALLAFNLDLERWYADADGDIRFLYLVADARLDALV